MALTLQIVGYKKSGKTTVLKDFLAVAQAKKYTVAVLKHDAHEASLDQAATDTGQFHQLGAQQIILQSRSEIFIRQQKPALVTQSAESLVQQYVAPDTDLILIEGYKSAAYPKIVLNKTAIDFEPSALQQVIAQASIFPEIVAANPKLKDFSNPQARQAWFQAWLKKSVTKGD
ncbi:molybdopterin-guanine dinucleotide biosynthesis protein B [Agrilactobacillus fermenti]|uniref:molybdopterin-guanine dinucleotide biosynthesis protein B n=1 Tax=Agrilactobacillus fermenti TaxID=2586909 RepID=UPI001E4807FC|nr:molybdopterin-guanine dinucleotide biosynthesis protein B [Agrilactobacillus fermenti]MCD2255677.1 molybdopterin-guanine dinucleotide biosynthesis protein B [Agrilactobacillus fermenti]